MKICWFIDFFLPHYRGGGQERLWQLGKRLVQRGHELTVVTMRHPGVPDHETLDGIDVWHVGPVVARPPQRSLFDFVKFFFAVRRWLRSHEYSVVCAEGLSIIPACLFSRIPVVATVHDVSVGGSDQWMKFGVLSALAEWLTLRLPEKIVTVSHAMKRVMMERGVSAARIEVVYNAVDAVALDTVSKKSLKVSTVVFIGRLVPHKHVDDLVDAFSGIAHEFPHARLVIFGSGPEEGCVRQEIEQLNLAQKVKVVPDAEDAEKLGVLKGASVLVLPSTREGFGIVLAEAGVCRIPVIAYDIPAVREVVEHGKTGLLAKARDIKGLSYALRAVLKNPKKASAMGRAGRAHILEKFNWDRSTVLLERQLDAFA
ncbi:glycosyltransferase family 4 protein [Candidatus Woesearchaeota archaeon]|nr:glycosyltransferase family 4 protein [Candidatus Woesearchaeota archaeon]